MLSQGVLLKPVLSLTRCFLCAGLPVDDKPREANSEVEMERNEELNRVLDRMVLYLRIVHSFDFYSGVRTTQREA